VRKVLRQSIFIAALASLMLAVSPGTAVASATVDTTRNVPFSVYSLCTGENMIGTATFHDVVVLNDNGTVHLTETIQGITAVGSTSGLRYTGSVEYLETDQLFPQPNAVFDSDTTYKITRTGEVATLTGMPDDLYIRFHDHTTLNANGEITSNFSKPAIDCH
jgi:hypothetical protein